MSPLEAYLGQLRASLPSSDRDVILAEAEDHLRDTVAAGLATGMTRREAEEAAISAFGSVRAVVQAHRARRGKAALLADAVLAVWKLGSAALIAVGASGAVAAAMNSLAGPAFVGAAATGARYPAASCRHWLEIWHQAHRCAQAAMLESSADAVSLRGLAGIAGVALLLLYCVARLVLRAAAQRHPRLPDPGAWSRDRFPAIAAAGSAAATLLMSVLAATGGYLGVPAGPGFYLSGIAAAVAACTGFTAWAVWRKREQRGQRAVSVQR